MKTIGGKIRSLRKESGFKKELLCSYSGIDESTLSKIENNSIKISIDQIEKLCALFGCSLEDFENNNVSINSIKSCLESNKIDVSDLIGISCINELALNSKRMAKAINK